MTRTLHGALAAALLAMVLAGGAFGQQPAAQSGDDEIQALIQQLSSPDEKVQKAAQEKLLGMGDKARIALEAHVRARAAAEGLLAKMDADKVAGATLVSVDLKKVPVSDAFAELSKQTGFDIQMMNEGMMQNAEPVTFSADKQPFWQVMRDLCAKTGVSVFNAGGGDRKIRIMPGQQMGQNAMKSPAVMQGAFMVAVTGLTRVSTVDLSNPQSINRNLMVQIQAFVEPKVRVVGFSRVPEIEQATDDKGNDLAGASAPGAGPGAMGGRMRGFGGGGFGGGRGAMWQVGTPLACPPALGEKLTSLKGKFRFTVQTRSETIEFTDLLKAQDVSKTAAGRRVMLREFKKSGDRQYQAQIVIYRDNMDQQAFFELNNSLGSLRLADADGHEYQSNQNGGGNNGEQFDLRLTFFANRGGNPDAAEPGEPATLSWEIPTATQEIVVPFEFKDLPLP